MAEDTPPTDIGDAPPAGDTPPADTPPADTPPGDSGTVLTDSGTPAGAPEEYADFRVPEGIEVNEGLLSSALPVFKDLGLSQIQAQQLMDMYAGQIQAETEAGTEAYNQTLQDWVEQAKSDSEIGGNSFDENVGAAKRAIDKFGTPALVQVLNDTGLGSHPEVIRLFHRVSKLIVEDDPGGDAKAPEGEKSAADILYPDLAKAG